MVEKEEKACFPKAYHHNEQLEDLLGPVLENPSHNNLADLFIQGHSNTLWCSPDGKIIKKWEGMSWSTPATREWVTYVGWWLSTFFQGVKQHCVKHVLQRISTHQQVNGVQSRVVQKLIPLSR